MPFHIVVCDDISLMRVDAVVNPANPGLLSDGGGACGALFRRAGEERMRAACAEVGGCPVGSAVATPGFDLPARFVVHAVGPVWQGGGEGEERALLSCYASALDVADGLGAASVALPLVSTGAFGFPVRLGLSVARRAVEDFLRDHDQDIYLVVPERRAIDIGSGLFEEIARRLDGAGLPAAGDGGAAGALSGDVPPRATPLRAWAPSVPAPTARFDALPGFEGGEDVVVAGLAAWEPPEAAREPAAAGPPALAPDRAFQPAGTSSAGTPPAGTPRRLGHGAPRELGDLLGNLDASFSETLLRLIDERGMTDAQAYRKANVSRQLFSKIRGDRAYRPSKQTVLAFAVALELTLPETNDLLARAGFALSHASASDVIVEYFIGRGCHDLFLINEALFAFDQALLGA